MEAAGLAFWALAFTWSMFQGWRGWKFQRLAFDHAATKPLQESETLHAIAAQDQSIHGKRRNALLFCLSDAFFHFAACFAGFVALSFLSRLIMVTSPSEVSVGASATFIFLALSGLLGVTGQLPFLIQHRMQGIPGA